MQPRDTLADWLHTNTSAPKDWRLVCQRLIESPDMQEAWPSLLKAGATPMQIFNMTNDSHQLARQDVLRRPNTDERESIEAVRKTATALLSALQGAQLLDRGAPLLDLDGQTVAVAWTTDCAKRLEESNPSVFPVLALPDLLRTLCLQCAELPDRTPANSIVRRRGDHDGEAARAFLRHLARRFRDAFGGEMPANLARIANAVFQMASPFTDDDVAKVLRQSPFKKEKGIA
jgi:hypothetical protein